jgi:hypothetical protein
VSTEAVLEPPKLVLATYAPRASKRPTSIALPSLVSVEPPIPRRPRKALATVTSPAVEKPTWGCAASFVSAPPKP